LISDGLLILLGSYLAWAGGAFVVVYTDLSRRPALDEHWGLAEWGAVSALVGGLALPFYFSSTRGTSAGLLRGTAFGIGIGFFALIIRMALSYYFRVPVV
jgi:hypothetical protein